MEKEKDITFFDLETRLEEAINSMDEDYNIVSKTQQHNLSMEDTRQEVLEEIIDGLIPIYNYDLLTVAGSNLWLGEYVPEGDKLNAFGCIREAIYQELYEKAQELLAKLNN